MTHKPLREQLEERFYRHEVDLIFDILTKRILQEVIPKEKKMWHKGDGPSDNELTNEESIGYNQALKQVRKAIKETLK